jgi:hypothetical protein
MAEHTTCRSCGAPIDWALTPKGQRIPLDVATHPDANIIVDDHGIARIVAKGEGTRISHFATCVDAKRFRKRDRR